MSETPGSRPRARPPGMAAPRVRMLVLGPSNIGDAILMSDVIAQLRQRFPEGHLTVVVGARATRLFAEDPRLQAVIDADAFSGARGRLRLALALWRYQPQVVVDLRHTLYPMLLKPGALWRYLRRPSRRVTHMRNRHLWFLRAQVPQMGAADQAVLAAPPLVFTPKDAAQVAALRRRLGLTAGARLVLIAPGARSHIKRWTADGFASVADRLVADTGVRIIFSGEPAEQPIINDVLGKMRQRAVSIVGLTTIRQLGLLLQEAALVIANDSATLHLASALRVPTVALFGPTDERKYGPTAPGSRVVRRTLFCRPCEQPQCAYTHECMRFIGTEEVLAAALAVLREGAGAGDREHERS